MIDVALGRTLLAHLPTDSLSLLPPFAHLACIYYMTVQMASREYFYVSSRDIKTPVSVEQKGIGTVILSHCSLLLGTIRFGLFTFNDEDGFYVFWGVHVHTP